jgi:DNA polymerase-4
LPAKINGIGPKATERLIGLGINTIGELAAAPVELLVRKFGQSTGTWLHRVAHGIDDRPVVTESEPKSISRESTFGTGFHAQQDRAELSEIFTALCMRVADDLKRKGYASRTIGIKLRYSDFHAVTRDVTCRAASAMALKSERLRGVPETGAADAKDSTARCPGQWSGAAGVFRGGSCCRSGKNRRFSECGAF